MFCVSYDLNDFYDDGLGIGFDYNDFFLSC